MKKFVWSLLLGLFCLQAKAEQTGQLFVNPYHPEFGKQEENLQLLDANLTNELVRFAERRDRIQQLWLEHMPQNPELIQRNSFVLRRVMDRSASRIMKSDYFKKTSLGRASDTLKEKMETDVTFKDEKNIEHKFDFKLALFQGQAFIQYSGFLKTQLRYDAGANNVAMIFQQDLSPFSSIGIESTLIGENQAQMVLLNFIW